MAIQLRFAAASDVGLVRKNNQDSGYASPNLFAVADGMGGAAAGDLASAVTIAHLAEIDGTYQPEELLPRLRMALNNAHTELVLRTAKNPELAGMGTTCVAVLRSGNKLAMAHIGDSRAYLLRGGKLTQITHDHTLVQYLVDTGQITAEEAKTHPKRNVIMRALGDDPEEREIAIDESVREAIPGDRWLLCSDGLYGPVSMELIHATLAGIADLEDCAETLLGHALTGGAPDNITVVVVDVIEVPDTAANADSHDTGEAPIPETNTTKVENIGFTQPQIVGAAETRKISILHAAEIQAIQAALIPTPGDGGSGQIGGSALVNLPDDPALIALPTPDSVALPQHETENSALLTPERDFANSQASTPIPRKRHRGAKIAAFSRFYFWFLVVCSLPTHGRRRNIM
ncbi:PP2C family protein-serine/threonine phosphatase [Arcanobacterium hippocoleae]|uniref:PP2C family protein-serine/threonine phosphatase n=1 Tax=Arcanobacterium hippocoleae TaxID=149017 RepID=UPI0033417DB9